MVTIIYINNGTFITKYEILAPDIADSIEIILRSISEDIRSERYSKDLCSFNIEKYTSHDMIYIDDGSFVTKYEILIPKFADSIETILRSMDRVYLNIEKYSKDNVTLKLEKINYNENFNTFELNYDHHKEKFSTLVSEAMTERTKL